MTVYCASKILTPFETFKEGCKRSADKLIALITKVALAIFRYFGSKTWSLPGLLIRFPYVTFKHLTQKNLPLTYTEELFGKGYTRFGQKMLQPDEAKPFVAYAAMAAAVSAGSDRDPDFITPLGIKRLAPPSLSLPLATIDQTLFDKTTGLKVALLQKPDGKITLVFGALNSAHSLKYEQKECDEITRKLWHSAAQGLCGGVPALYKQALHVFQMIKAALPDRDLEVTGQCLGGSLASYVGLKEGVTTYAINAFTLGVGLQQDIGEERLSFAEQFVTHVSSESDYMSHLPVIAGLFDAAVNFLGFRTPGNFGKKYLIPTAYKAYSRDTHWYFLGSLMQHLGFHKRALPCALSKADLLALST